MRDLDNGYRSEVDRINELEWYDILGKFDDANIYQTWAYGEVRYSRKGTSHIILKKNELIVAAAQVRLMRLPALAAGIAYVFWGPMWQLKNGPLDQDVYMQMLRAMVNEYSCKRRYVLRINPMIYGGDAGLLASRMKQEGFSQVTGRQPSRTLIKDLRTTKEELRKGLAQKWRNALNKAEKTNLQVIEGTEEKLIEDFILIYRDLVERKKFVEPNDINEFKQMQTKLPEKYKMKIMLCYQDGALAAGSIYSAMGNSGLYLFGATNDAGMKNNGSHLMQWKFIEWLKDNNYLFYDLNGINPETNPGTYKYKEGLNGKHGQDVYFMGQYQICDSALSRLLVDIGERAVTAWRKKRRRVDG